MSDTNELVMREDILDQYTGKGGNIVIPEGVRAIGFYAFQWVKEITTIQFPSTLEEIGHQAFGNSWIRTIFPAGQKDVPEGTMILPNGIKIIRTNAFASAGFRQVFIPDSIQLIEAGAFGNCFSLEYLEIRGTPELKNIFENFMKR